ncbi:MAG TPA: hypothetical protein VLS49_05390, partial [Usitatibacter sp.]|nr:hypothetical protein [Usitatibacter sp.]
GRSRAEGRVVTKQRFVGDTKSKPGATMRALFSALRTLGLVGIVGVVPDKKGRRTVLFEARVRPPETSARTTPTAATQAGDHGAARARRSASGAVPVARSEKSGGAQKCRAERKRHAARKGVV